MMSNQEFKELLDELKTERKQATASTPFQYAHAYSNHSLMNGMKLYPNLHISTENDSMQNYFALTFNTKETLLQARLDGLISQEMHDKLLIDLNKTTQT